MIADSLARPTDRAISAYYRENREDFRVPARASVKVVVIDKAPRAADSTAARERASELRQLILDGADFAEIATRESSDASTAPLGGDLGTFERGRMVPEFDTAVFEEPVGSLTEPVQTQFGFHVIEILDRTADSATARHILVPVELTDQSELELFSLADSLETLVEDRSLRRGRRGAGVGRPDRRPHAGFPVRRDRG